MKGGGPGALDGGWTPTFLRVCNRCGLKTFAHKGHCRNPRCSAFRTQEERNLWGVNPVLDQQVTEERSRALALEAYQEMQEAKAQQEEAAKAWLALEEERKKAEEEDENKGDDPEEDPPVPPHRGIPHWRMRRQARKQRRTSRR